MSSSAQTASVHASTALGSADFLPLKGTDHVEFYVGNARQAAYFYRVAFGMSLVAYAGPETGQRDRASYVVQQGKIRFVLTTPLRSGNAIAEHIARHGDAVRVIALWVDDARSAWEETTRRGASSVAVPEVLSDEHGQVVLSSIRTYGDTIHTFVERSGYTGPFLPGFRAIDNDPVARPIGLLHIDHMVGNVGWNEMDTWVKFYATVMGFSLYQHFDDKDISTEYSALMSKVMANGNGYVKFPINEPAEGKRKSQIEEYLDFYPGPGVQHIALATKDILDTVRKLQEQGVSFLQVPHSYYTELQGRVGAIDEPTDALEELGILVDRDEEGYMLQIFTRPVEDRPTVFFEIIQRKGSRSFGKGNFKALFEAIEREQQARGNL
ncbi:MAG TPA: 4-hydroxyphenylpyruvate dioxygenase [Granulicella sp.]|nr:4-hydroxyphenylpyruvate dioxygenase [Granulicella sp.]